MNESKKTVMDNLMEKGKTTGKLTAKEITDAFEKGRLRRRADGRIL